MAGELQGFRVDQIDVCGGDGKNNTVGLCNVLGNEVSCLLLNVGRLVANGDLGPLAPCRPCKKKVGMTNLGQTRQIDQRQTQDVGRVDFQVNGLPVDALVVSCYPRSLVLDLALDVGKVVEALAGNVEELSPLLLAGNARGRVGNVDFIVVVVVALAGQVDELENERSAGDDAAATGQEILADNVLEHRRLSRRL